MPVSSCLCSADSYIGLFFIFLIVSVAALLLALIMFLLKKKTTGCGDERHGNDLFPRLLLGSSSDFNGGKRGVFAF